MGASNHFFVGGSLLAVTMLLGGPAPAMEPAQAPASTPFPSAPALPSFFDGNRLPDLKDAWRTWDSAPASPSAAPDASVSSSPPSSDDATLAAAQAAMVRADQAGREAAAVREKAEELSRRFGSDSAPEQTGTADTAATTPESTGSVEPPTATLAPAALGAPPPANPAEPTTSAADTPDLPAKQGAAIDDTPAPGRSKAAAAPATPLRSKTAASEPVSAPAIVPGSKTTPGTSGKSDAMPTSIRSFGWDSQPQ